MDIWRWVTDTVRGVREEYPRLAWMLYSFAGFVVDNEHEQVEALYPEAMALAAEVRQPWVEVFFRHWLLQSRILRRSMIRESLPEAVELLERSHREDTRSCPQTVCVSQDICVAYGMADGPGYAQERLKVSEETLSQITPSWPCWRCISSEYADALLDMGRAEEALTFLDEQIVAIQQAGGDDTRDSLRGVIVRALLERGDLEEALAFNTQAEHEALGDGFSLSKRIDQSRILGRLGRYDEASEALPAWEEVEGTCSDYADWCDALYALAQADAWEGSEPAASYLIRAYTQLFSQGVIRDALALALRAGRLLLRVGHVLLARQVCEDAEAMLPELAALLGADEDVAAFRAEIEQRALADGPCEDAERKALLEEAGRGERIASERLARVYASFPEDWALLDAMCTIWERFHLFARARQALEAYQQTHKSDPRGVLALAHRLFEQPDESAFLEMCRRYADAEHGEILSGLAWYRARFAERKGEKREAIEHLRDSLTKHWRADSALWLAGLLREEGELEDALAVLEGLAIGEEGTEEADWERMLVGTRLARWDMVRAAGERLGFAPPAEVGLVWGEAGLCRVLFPEEGQVYVAMRIGPVTASIVEMAALGEPQHFEDIVTLAMPPLNLEALRAQKDEGTEGVLPLFRMDAIVKVADYRTFEMEGVHPGEAALITLRERLGSLGVAFQQRSGDQFVLYTHDDGESHDEHGEINDGEDHDDLNDGDGVSAHTETYDDEASERRGGSRTARMGSNDDESNDDESDDDESDDDESDGEESDDVTETLAEGVLGIYAYLAVPPSCSLAAVDALLMDWSEASNVEMGWVSLLRALQEEPETTDEKKTELAARLRDQQSLLGLYGL